MSKLEQEFKDERLVIGSIDVGAHPAFVERFRVQTVPSFLLFKQGSHVESIAGYRRAAELRDAMRRLLLSDPRESVFPESK